MADERRGRRDLPRVAVPPTLLQHRPDDADDAIAILGAGCAGLSTAVALVRRGVRRRIVLLDSRRGYTDDRTWCFWGDDRTPWASAATASWPAWTVATDSGGARRSVRGRPYRRLRGADFYRAALDELAAAGTVTLRLGERVLAVGDAGDPPEIRTTTGTIHPGVLLDARGPRLDPASLAEARASGVWLGQEFLGRRIRTARPVFDPSAATLLDFRVPQDDGVRFVYVLPTAPDEALVESVRFAGPRIDAPAHRRVLDRFLAERLGLTDDEVEVLGDERGCIPMTDLRSPTRVGPNHYVLGLAGGGARPSTGYAFQRIQRTAAAVAEAIATGHEPDLELDGPRRRLLDAVFLRFLERSPDQVPEVFRRMFARTPPAALLRFLTDASTPLDEALLVAALPKAPFLAILLGMAAERLPHPAPSRRHALRAG